MSIKKKTPQRNRMRENVQMLAEMGKFRKCLHKAHRSPRDKEVPSGRERLDQMDRCGCDILVILWKRLAASFPVYWTGPLESESWRGKERERDELASKKPCTFSGASPQTWPPPANFQLHKCPLPEDVGWPVGRSVGRVVSRVGRVGAGRARLLSTFTRSLARPFREGLRLHRGGGAGNQIAGD